MTPKKQALTSMGDTVALQLRSSDTIVSSRPQRGQIIELRCEMPKCYATRARYSIRDPSLTALAPAPITTAVMATVGTSSPERPALSRALHTERLRLA